MKILLAVDGSACTKQMLAWLAAHDEFLGTGHDYTVLTVTMPVPPHATGFFDRETVENYYRAETDEVHGHSALGSMVLGSVTNRVLNHCRTPVLVIR
jgi:nucleotide-binding universal stress UspA family protein